MAVGRKRKRGRREASGRLSRPSLKQLAALELARRESEMQVVLHQPHRHGERDQRAVSAFGRFTMRYKLRAELYNAGETYAGLLRQWRMAKGVPVQGRGAPGSGRIIDDDMVEGWGRRIAAIETAWRKRSINTLYVTRALIVDDFDVPDEFVEDCVAGIRILADEMGAWKMDQHPFMEERRAA